MDHFGRRSIEYWSVSFAKNRCIEAQAIITALSFWGNEFKNLYMENAHIPVHRDGGGKTKE